LGEGENRGFGQSEQRAQRGASAHYAESREIEDKRSAVSPPPSFCFVYITLNRVFYLLVLKTHFLLLLFVL